METCKGIGALGAAWIVCMTSLAVPADTPLDTTFTYQGQLKQSGSLEKDTADFQFTLWDAAAGGNPVGPVAAIDNVTLINGVFTVPLDFGAAAFDGNARWLEIAVRSPEVSGALTVLSPRQPIAATPYALHVAGPWLTGPDGSISYTGGNVGIGASPLDPYSTLDVRGSILATEPFGNGYRRAFMQSYQGLARFGATSANETRGPLSLVVGDTDCLRIDISGNIGLGAPAPLTPQAPLDIERGTSIYHGDNALLLLRKNTPTTVGFDAGVVFQIQNALGQYGEFNTAGIFDVLDEFANRHALALRATGSGASTMNTVAYFRGDGNVGIGTTTPDALLHLNRTGADDDVVIKMQNGATDWLVGVQGAIGDRFAIRANDSADNPLVIERGDGTGTQNDAIVIRSDGTVDMKTVRIGTTAPVRPLHIGGQSGGIELQGSAQSEILWANPAGQGTWVLSRRDDVGGANDDLKLIRYVPTFAGIALQVSNATGNVAIGTTPSSARLHVAGTTRTGVLEITGGSDLAEPFEVAGKHAIQAGMVVAIDPDHVGQLRLADRDYDRTVAGIVSGANGIQSGLTMKQEGSAADGSLPVALTGRVYCWCDADAGGPICPGDLLTTSDTPGHAMKATDHAKAQGAILGKAMSRLESGKGLVLVLVTLQ